MDLVGRSGPAAPGRPGPSRRVLLAAAGVGVLGAATACHSGGRSPAGGSRSGAEDASVVDWVRSRRAPYFIAHRGAGDVYPEHTLPSYEAALRWGAGALEISTSATKDGVLVCMHDLTLDRTTDARGPVRSRTWAQLQAVGVTQPQLGPRWSTAPLTPIPSLQQVLEAVGGKAVLCIEAKDDVDYPLLVELVEKHRLQKSVVVKLYYKSTRIEEAKAAGYPVFVYLGPDTSAATIRETASGLDRNDYLALPTTTTGGVELPDATVRTAVGTGIGTWVYPVHRRSEAERYYALGAQGIITSSIGYVSTDRPSADGDHWDSKAIAPGEMTRHPDRPENAPSWTGDDELTLARQGAQQFITLGQLAPLADAEGRYRVSFDARWNVLPSDPAAGFALAFGHLDDAYYEHRLGVSNGYHALYRSRGELSIYAHTAGQQDGDQLTGVASSRVKVGQWVSMRLDVTPSTAAWTRVDRDHEDGVVAADARFRGGYLHVGRNSADGSLSLRRLRVTGT